MLDYCSELEVDEIRITPPIQAAYKEYSETLFFALLESGFTILNADISNVLEYKRDVWSSFQGTLRRTIKKAGEYPLSYMIDAPVDDFIIPFKKTFEKHKTKPTHSYDELKWLKDKFPGRIIFDVAYYEDIPVSGVGRFVLNERLDSSFYLCNDPDYEHIQSLSYLIHKSLLDSNKKGFGAFEFGTSSVNMNGRENIFRFKERFGATGLFRKTFVWKKKEN